MCKPAAAAICLALNGTSVESCLKLLLDTELLLLLFFLVDSLLLLLLVRCRQC